MNKIFRNLLAGVSTVFLAGCFGDSNTLPVNLDFSRTNYGYINSGGYQAGSFFSWDRSTDTLFYLGDVPDFAPPGDSGRRDITATYSGGVELGADVPKLAKVQADAWIRRNSQFSISNAKRVPYNNVYTKITSFLNADDAGGGSIADEWGIKEAIGDPDSLFVIVRDVTFGDDISLEVNAEAGADGSISVPLAEGEVRVVIEGQGLEGISGDNVAVAFLVYVLEPYWNQKADAQTLAFRRVKRVDISRLPGLFRRVGTES